MKACALLVLVLACALPTSTAQTTIRVAPLGYDTIEGPSSSLLPFSYETSRSQYIFLASSLTTGGSLVMGINFRRDGNYSGTFAAITRNVQIDLSQTPVTPANMSVTFAANRGTATPVTVFTGTLNLPTLPPTSTPPAGWTVQIPFSQPQPVILTNGNLLLEFTCNGPGTVQDRYYLDADDVSTSAQAKTALIGMYCQGKNGEVFKCDPDASTWLLGGLAEVRWGPGGSLPTTITVFLGNRNTNWGSVPLPFDLAPLGAPGYGTDPCRVYTNILFSQNIGIGQVARFGPIPNLPTLVGATLFTQGLALVPGANNLGVIMGPAFSVTIAPSTGPVPEVNCAYSANSTTATTGKMLSSYSYRGPIIQFTGVFN